MKFNDTLHVQLGSSNLPAYSVPITCISCVRGSVSDISADPKCGTLLKFHIRYKTKERKEQLDAARVRFTFEDFTINPVDGTTEGVKVIGIAPKGIVRCPLRGTTDASKLPVQSNVKQEVMNTEYSREEKQQMSRFEGATDGKEVFFDWFRGKEVRGNDMPEAFDVFIVLKDPPSKKFKFHAKANVQIPNDYLLERGIRADPGLLTIVAGESDSGITVECGDNFRPRDGRPLPILDQLLDKWLDDNRESLNSSMIAIE